MDMAEKLLHDLPADAPDPAGRAGDQVTRSGNHDREQPFGYWVCMSRTTRNLALPEIIRS
jgi:hypothetical protein